VWLAVRLQPAVGQVLAVRQLRPVLLAAAIGSAMWAALSAWSPEGRVATVVAMAVVSGAAGAAYVLGLRAVHALPGRAPAGYRPVGGLA
jgi:hypothetical protein